LRGEKPLLAVGNTFEIIILFLKEKWKEEGSLWYSKGEVS
jgi:hypothetical protein